MKRFWLVKCELVKEETAADRDMQVLTQMISDGFHCRLDDLSPAIAKYHDSRYSNASAYNDSPASGTSFF